MACTEGLRSGSSGQEQLRPHAPESWHDADLAGELADAAHSSISDICSHCQLHGLGQCRGVLAWANHTRLALLENAHGVASSAITALHDDGLQGCLLYPGNLCHASASASASAACQPCTRAAQINTIWALCWLQPAAWAAETSAQNSSSTLAHQDPSPRAGST